MLRQVCKYLQPQVVCGHQCRPFSSYSDEENRHFLAELKGGSVDMSMNESTGIAAVILNNSTKMNAITGSMMVGLSDIVSELEGWDSGKAVLLYGAGGMFCSGGDLQTTMGKLDDNIKGGRMCAFMQKTMNRLFQLPLVSVALIQGNALGGGAEIACACDFRLMSHSAKIGFVQGRMGLTPGWGGGGRLVQLVGRTRALDLLMSSRVLTADQARQMGLVNSIITNDTEQGLEDSISWINHNVRGSPEVIQAAKKVVLNGIEGIHQKSMERERQIFMSVWSGPAHIKALESKVKHK